MSLPGTSEHPLRVAVVGAGPAGFFVTEHLLARDDLRVQVDMFERLPTPYGLVRLGVAPDHQKIKSVTRSFDKAAARAGFRFFGNVELGRHVTLDDLRAHYHQIVFTTGAQTDRPLGISGEDLERSHAATEFVAWFNGHPDYRGCTFDLSVKRVAIVGVGNVAVDVARVLCRTPEELSKTDITDYAEEALSASGIEEVYMLGRRGPAQAAFTNPEVRELGELPGADTMALPNEVELDPLSREDVERENDRTVNKKLEILRGFAAQQLTGKPRRLILRFLVAPVELVDDGTGGVGGMRIVENELVRDEGGTLRPRATGRFEELPVQLVFRSVGYRGVALDGLPFHDAWGIVPNDHGRVLVKGDAPLLGVYVAGWIKRGPTGVIGTNKPDAAETVEAMLADLARGHLLAPAHPAAESVDALVRSRQPHPVSFADWQRLDVLEVERGRPVGRPRVKFTTVEEILEALGKGPRLNI